MKVECIDGKQLTNGVRSVIRFTQYSNREKRDVFDSLDP